VLIVIADLLHGVADDGTDQRAFQRLMMVDRGSGNGADDRAARLAVMVAVVAAMMRRGKGVSGWQQQRKAEYGGVNSAGSSGSHYVVSDFDYLHHRCRSSIETSQP
jgi:hypothetical protein